MQLTERTQRAVLRYLSMMQALPFEKVVHHLPSLRDLRLKYEVPAEYGLALLRPLLRKELLTWQADAPPLVGEGAVQPTDGADSALRLLACGVCASSRAHASCW